MQRERDDGGAGAAIGGSSAAIKQRPKPPDRPLLPYMRFSRQMWAKLRDENPERPLWDIGKVIGQMWREASDHDKAVYQVEYEQEKSEYDKALKAYQAYLARTKNRAETTKNGTMPSFSSAMAMSCASGSSPVEHHHDLRLHSPVHCESVHDAAWRQLRRVARRTNPLLAGGGTNLLAGAHAKTLFNMRPIRSVGSGEPLVFSWPLTESAAHEILDTIRMVMNQYTELKAIINYYGRLEELDVTNYDQMKTLCDRFSKAAGAIIRLWKGATKPGGERANQEDLLKLIIILAYNRAVTDVHRLNRHYRAFSDETYGETSYRRLQLIIDELRPTGTDVFVDLGSGVGQLVVQMAGGSKVKKAVGIEIAALPAHYARTLEQEFRRWMKWHGKKFRPFELRMGNFLEKEHRDLITKEATIIFINNLAFTSDLEAKIKRDLLIDLKDGTRIISLKSYVDRDPTRAITDRQMNDLSAIMDVRELTPCPDSVSWTGNNVPFYLHTVRRKKLDEYFEEKKEQASATDRKRKHEE